MVKNKKKQILALLKHANDEKKKYKLNKKFINLSQACEKTWVAFTLLLEYKSGIEIHGGRRIDSMSNDLGLYQLFIECRLLHVYHYEGSAGVEMQEIVNLIDVVHVEIRKETKDVR